MARGRARYQRGRVVATEGGSWEIHYNVYLTDPTTGKPKRHHRSRVVGYKPKMHRADAEKILGAELAAINGGPVTRARRVPPVGAAHGDVEIPHPIAKWDASPCAKATGDADSSGQLAAPAPVPGREQTGNGISSYVSGAPEELLHAWQERSTPDRDAGPTRTQRHSYHPRHLYPGCRPGGRQNGEPGYKPHTRFGWGG